MVEDIAAFLLPGRSGFRGRPTAPAAERKRAGVIAKVGVDVARRSSHAPQAARADFARRRQGRPSGVRVARRSRQAPHRGRPGALPRPSRRGRRVRPVHAASLRRHRPQELDYVKLILADFFHAHTYYMGLVRRPEPVNFYDGMLRVVAPEGQETVKFAPNKYLDYIASASSRGAT